MTCRRFAIGSSALAAFVHVWHAMHVVCEMESAMDSTRLETAMESARVQTCRICGALVTDLVLEAHGDDLLGFCMPSRDSM